MHTGTTPQPILTAKWDMHHKKGVGNTTYSLPQTNNDDLVDICHSVLIKWTIKSSKQGTFPVPQSSQLLPTFGTISHHAKDLALLQQTNAQSETQGDNYWYSLHTTVAGNDPSRIITIIIAPPSVACISLNYVVQVGRSECIPPLVLFFFLSRKKTRATQVNSQTKHQL